ncbi:unnamed protein product [Arctia plantaginis]|uniref:Uncharacterized protein n=1 Tax=Arctia plantaginis TaxID=874455 RepID=A0A8S1BMV3_ARCPL|nr:unnamed protein product [Arctia plantaginis]
MVREGCSTSKDHKTCSPNEDLSLSTDDVDGHHAQREHTPVTRESCKVINSILEDDSLIAVCSQNGKVQSNGLVKESTEPLNIPLKGALIEEGQLQEERCLVEQSSVVDETCVVEDDELIENDGLEHDINRVEVECLIEEGGSSFAEIYPPSTVMENCPSNPAAGQGLCIVVDATNGSSTIIHQWLTEKDVEYVIEHVSEAD